MNSLIEIKTVPIEIQVKSTQAKLEYARGTAEMEISRDSGGLSIKSRPIQIKIDTFEARNSMSPASPASATSQIASRGNQQVYQATAVLAQEGRAMMEAQINQDMIPQFAKQQNIGKLHNVNVQFLPKVGPDIAWEGGEINVRYEMDKLSFDWRMNQMDFTFTPGDIEFTVTQQPDVIIQYVGGPLYVPPSADPDYEPIDVKA